MPRHTHKQKATETRAGAKKKKEEVDSCRGRAGVESVVVGHEGTYKPNDTLMVNGGLC